MNVLETIRWWHKARANTSCWDSQTYLCGVWENFLQNFTSDIQSLLSFRGSDLDKIGKINNEIKSKLEEDITYSQIKQRIKALRLGSVGGPDGLLARLLNYFFKVLPNIVLRAMREITLFESQPYKLSKRFLIFINKENSNKKCYKRLRPITLIINL